MESFDDSIELDEMKTFFNQYISTSWIFNAENHLKKLISCTLLPGFIDCFAEDNTINDYDKLSEKLYKVYIFFLDLFQIKQRFKRIRFQFLVNHRLTSEMINEPYIENRITVNNLRRAVLVEIEKSFQEETSSTIEK